MAFPLAMVGAGLSAFSDASSALGGFFDNSENERIHAENKRRVAEIDAANQQRHFSNLSIGAKFRNQKARTQGNLFNIDTAASEARAASQRQIDTELDKFMLDNQSSYIKMMQGKRGPMSGRMNVGGIELIVPVLDAGKVRNKLQNKLCTTNYCQKTT